ncbi:MAG: protein phosphatase CheZ, partial [Deltaproteobacteria bacterium]|nr:protein phosphatase CheZ [Deltaproteobacteria bacterium]
GCTDLSMITMIIRPDKRHYRDSGYPDRIGKQARELSLAELQGHPRVASEMEDARERLRRYGDAL